jgi:tetratricopeptide (TPR) repeat protein
MILADHRGAASEALAFARRSAKWLEEYESTGGVDPLEAEQVAITYINVGTRYVEEDQYDEALWLCRRGFEIAQAAGIEKQTGASLMSVAEVYRRKGDLDKALEVIRQSVTTLEPRAGATDRGRTNAYLNALSREGRILGEDETVSMGRFKEAVTPLGRAFAIAEMGVRQDPNDGDSRGRMGTTGLVLADVLRHVDSRRALAVYDQTLSGLAKIPNNPRARLQEVRALTGSSDPLLQLGRSAEARQRLDTAFEQLSQLKLYPAERLEPGSIAVRALSARAEYEAAQGGAVHAIEIYEELLRRVLLAEPKPQISLEDAVHLSSIYASTARLQRRSGRKDRASSLEARRMELWRHWDTKLPNNNFVRRQVRDASGPVQ